MDIFAEPESTDRQACSIAGSYACQTNWTSYTVIQSPWVRYDIINVCDPEFSWKEEIKNQEGAGRTNVAG